MPYLQILKNCFVVTTILQEVPVSVRGAKDFSRPQKFSNGLIYERKINGFWIWKTVSFKTEGKEDSRLCNVFTYVSHIDMSRKHLKTLSQNEIHPIEQKRRLCLAIDLMFNANATGSPRANPERIQNFLDVDSEINFVLDLWHFNIFPHYLWSTQPIVSHALSLVSA